MLIAVAEAAAVEVVAVEAVTVELLQVVRVQLYWSSHVRRELVLQLLLVFLFNYNE